MHTQVSAVLLLLALASGSVGCGGEDVTVLAPAWRAAFEPSRTTPGANQVRLALASTDGDTVEIDVVIEGPTASSDLYSLAFDLLLDNPQVAEYVQGSATAGPALTVSGSQGMQVLAGQAGDRVVVGLSKTGGGSGNGIAGGTQTLLLTLAFRVTGGGVCRICLAGSQGTCVNPQMGPAALDSSGVAIGSIQFDPAFALILGL